MLVNDLHHFLDLPADVPGPARRLAQHFGNIVRAAIAGDVVAEANHGPNRRRRQRLDVAFDTLSAISQTLNGR